MIDQRHPRNMNLFGDVDCRRNRLERARPRKPPNTPNMNGTSVHHPPPHPRRHHFTGLTQTSPHKTRIKPHIILTQAAPGKIPGPEQSTHKRVRVLKEAPNLFSKHGNVEILKSLKPITPLHFSPHSLFHLTQWIRRSLSFLPCQKLLISD